MIELVGDQLFQWDVDRKVRIIGDATHAHFANQGDSKAPIMPVENGEADVPNYLLQSGKTLVVYAVKDGVTLEFKHFSVRDRERPENYVYDDDQRNYIYELIQSVEDAVLAADGAVKTAENAVSKAATAVEEAERVTDELKTARDNGEFNGPKGDPGKDGADGKNGADGKDGANGYTPVRGVDYWTDADKAEIKSYVDEAILGGAW